MQRCCDGSRRIQPVLGFEQWGWGGGMMAGRQGSAVLLLRVIMQQHTDDVTAHLHVERRCL